MAQTTYEKEIHTLDCNYRSFVLAMSLSPVSAWGRDREEGKGGEKGVGHEGKEELESTYAFKGITTAQPRLSSLHWAPLLKGSTNLP